LIDRWLYATIFEVEFVHRVVSRSGTELTRDAFPKLSISRGGATCPVPMRFPDASPHPPSRGSPPCNE
jgi:hypothetical protein